MPVVGAAASSRHRNAPRRQSLSPPVTTGGLLVTRKMPVPQKSKSNLNSKKKGSSSSMRRLPTEKQQSFRKKMTDRMEQWTSQPVLQKQVSDEVSIASSSRSMRTNKTNRSRSPKPQSYSSRQVSGSGRSRSPHRGGARGHSPHRGARGHSPYRGRGLSPKRSHRSDALSESKTQESFLCLEPRKAPIKTQMSIRNVISGGRDGKNEAGLKRFLSRGNSIRTAETLQSLETISDRLNPEAKPLSDCFPPTSSSQQFLIRRPSAKGELTTIENQKGVIVGVVEETHYGRWLLKNADGKVCAMMLLHDEKYSSKKFSICGSEPVVYKQTMKYDQVGFGYYKWAHVKNSGGFGGTIVLKHTRDEIKQKDYTYCTKPFGSVFRIKKTRGHAIVDEDKKECSKLIPLHNTGRAIQIGPNLDTALMLCYSVIIDEILENRIK